MALMLEPGHRRNHKGETIDGKNKLVEISDETWNTHGKKHGLIMMMNKIL